MGKRKYTEAQHKAAVKWEEKNYDRISVGMLRGGDINKAALQAAAAANGESVNQYVVEAIRRRMESERGDPEPRPDAAQNGGTT